MNTVKALLGKSLSYEDKLSVKVLGPHRPDLKLKQEYSCRSKVYSRKFNPSMYEKYSWLCGCAEENAFFCFPCLIFGNDDVWGTTGVKDLKHLSEKLTKHVSSKKHMSNNLSFNLLGKIDIRQQLDDGYRQSIVKQHEAVDKNRHVLSRIIDCIKFCGVFELALRGRDETEKSENPGIFKGLVNFVSSLDNALKEHLDTSTVFKGTSKTIQNELLDAMLVVCRREIKKQIKQADSVAIQADETTDAACMTQMSVIVRYLKNSEAVERFWGYFQPSNHTAEGLATVLIDQLKEIGVNETPNKLIAQTYDGASVMSGVRGGVQALLREVYPQAKFIHCYAHQSNLIMQEASNNITVIKIFFANVQGLSTFFSRSAKRTQILDSIVHNRLPKSAPTRWNFQSRAVNSIYENKDLLVECMEHIYANEKKDTSAISQACGFAKLLKNKDFIYWLNFFHKIMPNVDILFNQVQKDSVNSTAMVDIISNFVNSIKKIRDEIPVETLDCIQSQATKRRRMESVGEQNGVTAINYCDNIIARCHERFQFTAHLSAAKLFVVRFFKQYHKVFPTKDYMTTLSEYPSINGAKFKTELEILYSREDIHCASGAVPLLQLIIENNLTEIFSECVKVMSIIITLPMTTVENERCFSTLKRIKTFLRNTMGQDRLNALAMLSIEKKMINSMTDFNHQVIDVFAQEKSRRMDFIYK